jgi:hypothetical protein
MTSVEIRKLTPIAATYVAAYIRAYDRAELEAYQPAGDIAELAYFLATTNGWNFYASIDDIPVFAFGVVVHPLSPHMGSAWGFGTDKTRKVVPEITRFVREALVPELVESGLRRVEVRALATHTSSVRWLARSLGALPECDLPQAGANGETFVQLAWISDVPSNTR